MDDYGTIDPAALSSTAGSNNISAHRGIKRSRSPEEYADLPQADQNNGEDVKPRKRGRPPKAKPVESPSMAAQAATSTTGAVHTPQVNREAVHQSSPTQTSPQRSTPGSGGRQAVLKALPTVRDHTTDQVNPEKDEYIAREFDDAGEAKVDANGYLSDGREYRIRTFNVPKRGDRLFMLATECARALAYRDSYLLFNKNRSLYKIIASQEEKESLIAQDILPYSYRSRQIAIVTARSMFRQFGSRVIEGGRRVRDDYWESKAIKQGFTEEDAAGEKRPGAAKQREAERAESSNAPPVITVAALPHREIIYSNAHGLDGHPPVPPGIHPVTLAPLATNNALSPDDLRARDYSNIARPRQDVTGPAYQDRSQPSSATEILTQATNAVDWNRNLTQARVVRTQYYDDYWRRPHEPPTPPPQPEIDVGIAAQHSMHSPQAPTHMGSLGLGSVQQNMMAHKSNASQMMAHQAYVPPQMHQQNPLAQSPLRSMHQQLPSAQMHQGSPAMSMSSMPGRQASYGYGAGQMFPPPQPQQSPMAQPYHMPQYGQPQQTPQPLQSPMHPPSQLPQNMGFTGMNAMGNPGYPGMNRGMYHASPSPQQFSMGAHQSSNAQQAGMSGWAPPTSSMPQDWQRYQ